MKIGFSSMNTHRQIQPAELAVAVEERGFESLWYGEHSQIPASRESDHPRDAELLDPYKHMMDPYVSLTVAGTVTRTLVLGTSVSLLLERELFSQAKTLVLWCNGPWCGQSPTAIQGLLSIGYPRDRLRYYRGGMQLWRIFGLPVVSPKGEPIDF